MKKALVIGGGMAGCAATHLLMQKGGWDITLVDTAPFLGAGVRTSWYGGHPYTFGPRHFLTRREDVFNYLNEIIPLRRCPEHEFITYVEQDGAFYNFPIHVDDIAKMPDKDLIEKERKELKGIENAHNLEDYWIGSVGQTLYEKYIKNYSKKMWLGAENSLIDDFKWSPKGAPITEGPRAAWTDAISAYPYAANGYDDYFDIATKGADIHLSTRIEAYDIPNKTVIIDGEKRSFDLIVSTISPDILFDEAYGELPYVGRDLDLIVFPTESVFPENVYFLYYANNERFTRLVEYKRFTGHKSPTTLIGMEVPSRNGKFYPMPYLSEINKAEQYYAEMPEGVYSIGRAGSYQYGLDMDDCIEQAMNMMEELDHGGREHPVPICSALEYRRK